MDNNKTLLVKNNILFLYFMLYINQDILRNIVDNSVNITRDPKFKIMFLYDGNNTIHPAYINDE